jgi:hypothetical protein
MVAPLVLLSDAAKSAQHQPQQLPSTATTTAAASSIDTTTAAATPGALQRHLCIVAMKVSVMRAL